MAALLWVLRKKLGGWEEGRVLASFTRALVASLLMAGLIYGLMAEAPFLSLKMQAVLFGSLAIGIYVFLAWVLRSPELAALPRMLKR